LPLIGSIIWFAVGRDWGGRTEAVPFGDPRRTEAAADRMSGMSAADRATLEAERRLAEKEARVRRLEAEVRAKRDQRGGDAAG
jgi:predicted nicotinamide N-methyase